MVSWSNKNVIQSLWANLHQLVKIAGNQITAKSLEIGKIVIRNSTFFKHFAEPICLLELKNNENKSKFDDDPIVLDEPKTPLVGNPVNCKD